MTPEGLAGLVLDPAAPAVAVRAAPTGLVLSDAAQPDDPIVFANPEAIRRALVAATPIDIQLVNYRRNGRRFVNHLHISPMFDAGGCLTHFLGIRHDVTVRVRAELA